MGNENERIAIDSSGLNTSKLHLIGNQVSDALFYFLTHTPLPLAGIQETGKKIIVCLSGHDFRVKEYQLNASGLKVRNNRDGVKNVQSILEQNPEAVALVSQLAKRYLDKESALDFYRSRIFCLVQWKWWITNKIPWWKKYKIKNVGIRF